MNLTHHIKNILKGLQKRFFSNFCLSKTGSVALTLIAFLSSCSDKALDVDTEDPIIESSSNETYYLGVRIYNAAAIGDNTRAGELDSEGSDYDNSDKKFNQGLASENALFSGFSNAPDSPHFILVFGEQKDGQDEDDSKLQAILPLFDWDYEQNLDQESKPTVDNTYYTFYSSAKKTEVPSNFNTRTVLAVLNASKALKADLQNKLRAGTKYKDIREMNIGSPATENSDYLFYVDDSNPENVTKYFTITSSIISTPESNSTVNGVSTTNPAYYGPALSRRETANYKWYPTKEQAVEFPVFSFFLERMQSKYTVVFNCTSDETKKYYFGDERDSPTDGVIPVEHLVLTHGVDFTHDENNQDIELQYVPKYTRSTSMAEINPVLVKKTKNFKINITGWNVNGIEKQEPLFKQLTPGAEYYGVNNWNPESLRAFRNFWAEGYDYIGEGSSYMDQFRTTTDHGTIGLKPSSLTPYYSKESASSLVFFDYETLAQRNIHQYSPENTIDPTKNQYNTTYPVESNEVLRKNTHIILTAQLLIGPSEKGLTGDSYDGLDPEGVYAAKSFDEDGMAIDRLNDLDAECKLFMNNIYWNEAAYKAYVVEYLGYMMLTEENQKIFGEGYTYKYTDPDTKVENTISDVTYANNGIIYVSQTANATQPGPATGSYFELGHLEMENGDNMVYVTPNNAVHLYIRNANYNASLPVSDPNSKEFIEIDKSLVVDLAKRHREYFAQHFNSGRMYYAIPVTHYGANTIDSSDKINKEDIGIGRYGNVRNHWYRFTIKSIRNIGRAVDKIDEPIVPNNVPVYNALGVELNVLPWHTISTDVDISGQRPYIDPNQIDIDLYLKADDWNYQGTEKYL